MAGIKDFKKVANANEDVSKLQERLQEFFAPLVANPLLDGTLLVNVSIGTSITKIPHQLRRAPIGWIIVDKSATADIWQPNKDLSTAFLNLQATNPITATIWVF